MANNEELKRAIGYLQMAAQEAYQSLETGNLHRTMFHLGQLHGKSLLIADRITDLIEANRHKCS